MEELSSPMIMLVLFLFLEISFGRIIFEPKKNFAVSLVKYFFQEDIFPRINHLRVVNFGYEIRDTIEFRILMRSLHDEDAEATLMFSDFNKTVLNPSDSVFLILLSASHIENVIQFIQNMYVKRFELINAVILFNSEFTKEEFNKLFDKPRAKTFHHIIYAFPSFEPPVKGVSLKVDTETLVFYLENVVLSKLSSAFNIVKFTTNKFKIHKTINMLRQKQEQYRNLINKFPLKILLYLRPLSVEKSTPNSTKPFRGIDINVLNILANSLGSPYTLELGPPEEYGIIYPNNTLTRALRLIRNGSYSLGINRYPVMQSGEGAMVVPYDHEEFCFIMLMPENQLRKWSVWMPFRILLWICLLLTHVTIYAIYMLVREKDWNVIWLFQSTVSSIQFPATRSSHRVLWSHWLFFNMLTNTVYTCFFVTQIVPRKKQHPYKTLQDLFTNNITLLSEAGHFQDIQDSFHSNTLTPYYGAPEQINSSSALLTSYLTRLKTFKLFGSHFYMVDECLVHRTVGPLTSTRNPNSRFAVKVMQRVIAAGLKEYWLDVYLNSIILSGNKNKDDSDAYEKEKYAPVTLKELENVFILFILGLILSSIVLLCEIIHFKLTKPRVKIRPEIVRVFPYTD